MRLKTLRFAHPLDLAERRDCDGNLVPTVILSGAAAWTRSVERPLVGRKRCRICGRGPKAHSRHYCLGCSRTGDDLSLEAQRAAAAAREQLQRAIARRRAAAERKTQNRQAA